MGYTLPPLSKHIRVLTAEESDRLDKADPHLPKSLKDCVTCRGKKTFRWWKEYGISTDIVDYDCPCAEQFVLFKYLLNAGLPKDLQRYGLGDLVAVDPSATEAMTDYVTDHEFFISQGHGFIFRGSRGTGKTLLAALMLKQLLDKGVDGYYVVFTDMLDAFAAGWRDDAAKVWFDSRIKSAPLLVVDDIGKEHPNRVSMSSVAIDNVFRSRVQAGRPTIITTNLTPAEMSANYSSALETMAGKSLSFEFGGDSWRDSEEERTRNEIEMRLRLTRPIVIQ